MSEKRPGDPGRTTYVYVSAMVIAFGLVATVWLAFLTIVFWSSGVVGELWPVAVLTTYSVLTMAWFTLDRALALRRHVRGHRRADKLAAELSGRYLS